MLSGIKLRFFSPNYSPVVIAVLAIAVNIAFSASCIWAQADITSLPENVRARMTKQIPVTDELLYELEKDYIQLLQKSPHAQQLLEAEDLLIATNDNFHWTNYSSASKILCATRDISAIPLLLRYIVLHAHRSSSHVMIPEYCKTISLISGREMENLYESGPELESRMRTRVQKVVNEWWREAKSSIVTDPEKMDDDQLQVIVTRLLKQVRSDGDFTGSGGDRDSAYGAYHNVNYRLLSDEATDRHAISPLLGSMVPMVLEPSGYRTASTHELRPATGEFPYEAVVILAELAKNDSNESIQEIAADEKQNSTVRMACMLALYRAGYPYQTELMLALSENETAMEKRLIGILTLRWGNAHAVPVLLGYMNDPNIEIATAAACALVDAQPAEAIPVFQKILDRNFDESPLMLLGALAEFKSPEARELLKTLLTDAVEGKRNSEHLYRILDAFADAWEVPRNIYYDGNDGNYKKQALLALAWSHELSKKEEADRLRLVSLVESLRTQLKVAEEIETVRHNEYKRLLGLQSDGIVTTAESQKAYEQLQVASAETESIREKLRKEEIELRLLTRPGH